MKTEQIRNKMKCFLFFLTSVLMITGCTGDKRIIERTGFIHVEAFDLLENGENAFGIEIPSADPQSETDRFVLHTTAKSVSEAKLKLANQINLLLVSGQLRTVLIGKELAHKGFKDRIDPLMRDPTVSEYAKLMIVNGSAIDLLSKDYEGQPRTVRYITRLIEKKANLHMIPLTSLYSFVRDYLNDGVDPIAPIIADNGKTIEVEGIAIFNDFEQVGSIPANRSLIFSALKRSFRSRELAIDLADISDHSTSAYLVGLNSNRKVKVKMDPNGQIHVYYDAKITTSVFEYVGDLKISKNPDQQILEDTLSEKLTDEANEIVKYLQEKQADALGVGMFVRKKFSYAQWSQMDWREEFKNVKIHCNIKVKIKDAGFRL